MHTLSRRYTIITLTVWALAVSAPAFARPGGGGVPKEVQAEIESASALMDAGQHDQAIAACRAILVRVPSLTLLNLQIGNALRLKKDFDGRSPRPIRSSRPTRPTSARGSRSG